MTFIRLSFEPERLPDDFYPSIGHLLAAEERGARLHASPIPWDLDRADAVLAEVYRCCERARVSGKADTKARRNVLASCRHVATAHYLDHDPLLWTEQESLEALIARWDEPPEDLARYGIWWEFQ